VAPAPTEIQWEGVLHGICAWLECAEAGMQLNRPRWMECIRMERKGEKCGACVEMALRKCRHCNGSEASLSR